MTPTPSTGQEPEPVREAREQIRIRQPGEEPAYRGRVYAASELVAAYEAGLQATLARPDSGGGSRESVARVIWETFCRQGGPWSEGPSGSASTAAGQTCLGTASAILALLASPKVEGAWSPGTPAEIVRRLDSLRHGLDTATRDGIADDLAAIATEVELARETPTEHPQAPPGYVVELCEDCPPVAYSTDKTRCGPCPRKTARPVLPEQGGE